MNGFCGVLLFKCILLHGEEMGLENWPVKELRLYYEHFCHKLLYKRFKALSVRAILWPVLF